MRWKRVVVIAFSSIASVTLLAGHGLAEVLIRTGFEAAEGYQVGKLTPGQPDPVDDIGWDGNTWDDLGGATADPMGNVVAAGDAPQGSQYFQRLGGGNQNLALREFPPISAADGDFSIRWLVRLDTDEAIPPYFNNYATIELDDTGPGGRIMTFRYNQQGSIDLSAVQNGIAQWDGTGAATLASGLNEFVKGGLNVYWDNREIEIFLEDVAGGWESIGFYPFRETDTDQVDRLFLGIGPGGTANQGVSWDDVVMSSVMLPEPIGVDRRLQAGDADQDLDFDQLDLVRVQIAAKYLTGLPATWGDGDWDGAPGGEPGNPPPGNGLFDQLDIIAALAAGTYLQGPYAAINQGSADSAMGASSGVPAPYQRGSFDDDADGNHFNANSDPSARSLSFGNGFQAGLAEGSLLNDLSVVGPLAGGGDLGDVELVYVPEPSTLLLLNLALVWLLGRGCSRGR